MGRSILTNKDEQAARIIFGNMDILRPAQIDRVLQFPRGTCSEYMKHPYKAPLDRLAKLCKQLRLTDEQIAQLVKTYY